MTSPSPEPPAHNKLVSLLRQGPHNNNVAQWSGRVAELLLSESCLRVANTTFDFREIEFYFHSDGFPDPFVHCDEQQRESATWYFHRTGQSLRGGTYKGLDLTFGPKGTYGGILLRAIRDAKGKFTSGSSLCVDTIVQAAAAPDHKTLSPIARSTSAFSPENVMTVCPREPSPTTIYRTARVGLTLKRAQSHPRMVDYIAQRLRFLTGRNELESKLENKGRHLLHIALHQDEQSPEQIAAISGARPSVVQRHIHDYEEGKSMAVREFFGRGLSTGDACAMLGAVAVRFRKEP